MGNRNFPLAIVIHDKLAPGPPRKAHLIALGVWDDLILASLDHFA